MQFTELEIPGVFKVDLAPIEDARGFFARQFCRDEMARFGIDANIVQCNTTLTHEPGTIRGLHFQRPPKAETKFVRCLRGAVMDVAVDVRAGSATYGQWCSAELNEENRSMMVVPKGFAHGFQVLSECTELLYFHTEFYSKPDEGGLNPLDSQLRIHWPLTDSKLSERDSQLPMLKELKAIEL